MASGGMTFLNTFQSPNPAAANSTFSPNMSNSTNNFSSPPPPPDRAQTSSTTLANDIVNKKADTSLYQTCIQLRKRLAFVPGFEPYLREMDMEEMESGEETDPVTSMWNMLRQGMPLLALYNASNPPQPLAINRARVKEANIPKAAAFKFLQACLDDLRIPQDQCFLVTDLYGQDTTGFVKVLRVINKVVDILAERGLLFQQHDAPSTQGVTDSQQKSHSEMIVEEMVITERNYVQHLETLQAFKDQLEQSGALPGDIIHDIFLNLNNLLDFQQRFLIRIEQQNAIDAAQQNWGQLFVQYQDGFRVYEPFIGNQHQGNETVTKHWSTIEKVQYTPEVQGMVGSVTVLTGFLLKPFQRLAKYPLLLEELRKRGELDPARMEDLNAGASAMKTVLDRANALLQKADLAKEVSELVTLVDDWKGHKLEHFGDLVLSGTWPVVKGESSKDSQRDYKIFLFQRILLCCKEINPNKAKNRLTAKNNPAKTGKGKLQLKGRIFIQNICDVVQLQPAQNGSASYTLQIWWKGDPGIESFTIRFPQAEHQKKWFDQILQLRNQFPSSSNRATLNTDPYQNNPNFVSLSGLTLENPYENQMDDDAGDMMGRDPRGMDAGSIDSRSMDSRMSSASTLYNDGPGYSTSRNASASSLGQRSRSTTASSIARQQPPPARFPMADPPIGFQAQQQQQQQGLRLTTNVPPGQEGAGASVFSPAGDSPNSSRISQMSNGYFPRQGSVSNASWAPDPNKHYTAPPMGRAQTQNDVPNQDYGMNGRSIQRPSLPAVSSHSSGSIPTVRSRSISNPDVNGYSPGRSRAQNGQLPSGDDVPVPPIPPHMVGMRGPVNRSNTNSPTDGLRSARGMPPGQPPPSARGPSFQHYNSYAYDQTHAQLKNNTNAMAGAGRVLSPPMSASAIQNPPPMANQDAALPYVSQLKVKIHYDPDPDKNYVTIVIGSNIGWETLRGRIDHKMQKNTRAQIAESTARLRYVDVEGDMVTINEDEDVDMAIEVWKEKYRDQLFKNQLPDLDLYWKEVTPKTPN